MPCSICGTIVGGGDGMVCMGCGNIETPLQANASSFNSPSGMCLQCGGRGVDLEPHLERLVLDKRITPRGVLETVDASSALQYLLKGKLRPYADLPFVELPDDARTHTLYGLKIRGTSHLLRARPGPRRRHRLQADRSVA
jgi:excinuclease UvrABC ATPase subunit